MATSLAAAFMAVESDAWLATTAALVAMGLAGEIAAPQASGPGTFRSYLLDAVANLNAEVFEHRQKVSLA
jgi:hydroxyethylthiazole kinase